MRMRASALLLAAVGTLAATSAQALTITATFKNETALWGGSAPGSISQTSCSTSGSPTYPCPSAATITNSSGGSDVRVFTYPAPTSLPYEQNDFTAVYQSSGSRQCYFFFRISKNSLQQWGYNSAQASPSNGAECSFTNISVNSSTGNANITFVFRK